MKYAILLDFGSTYTKVVCVDLLQRKVILTDKFPSTVHVDAGIALRQCFDAAEKALGKKAFGEALKLSSSSAAGGLRIAVSGLSESLSMRAGRNASFGAGGKVVYTGTGRLRPEDVEAVKNSDAEILLLCGGYEGGNYAHILHNAELLSSSELNIPVIYAGNSCVMKEVRRLFLSRGKECFTAENMMPDVGVLNIESTVDIIRDLFMSRITGMNGVGTVRSAVDGPITPTPAAVLAAGELLFHGSKGQQGIGPYLMMDIGGATTDVYSFSENRSYKGAKYIGMPEPDVKRTVEGDMGMRESSVCLLKEVGLKSFSADCGLPEETVLASIMRRTAEKEYIPCGKEEKRIDLEIAENAVRISARRHSGSVEKEFCGGCRLVQRGKNLTEIRTVIGTGGILVNNPQEISEKILKNAELLPQEEGRILLPQRVTALVDRDYIFFAAGLLRNYDEEAALEIMKQSIGISEKENFTR